MHCKSKMVPEAALSPEGTSASSVRTQLCQIHQCDRYCNGLGPRAGAWRARPRASRARPYSNKTKRFWNSSGRGRQRSEPHFSLPVFKNEISNKHGGGSPQLSSKEETSPLGLETRKPDQSPSVATPAGKVKGAALPASRPFPSPAGAQQTQKTSCITHFRGLTARWGQSWHGP